MSNDAGRQILRLCRGDPETAAAARHRPAILAQMQPIGIERGQSFDIDKTGPAIKAGLETVPEDAQELMAWKVATIARVAGGRSMNTDTMGVYGNYYLERDRQSAWPRCEPAGGCDLSNQPCGQHRKAAGWRQPLRPPFREGRHTARERLLVDHLV
jgi:hypothetical protein